MTVSRLFKLKVYGEICKRLIDYFDSNPGKGERENSLFWVNQLKETRRKYAALKREGAV